MYEEKKDGKNELTSNNLKEVNLEELKKNLAMYDS